MLYNDDCIKIMNSLPDNSIDMIFADPPYFLSNNGVSINSGKIVSVNKGDWDKKENYTDINQFTFDWIQSCYQILKPGGTIWVSGTKHNSFTIKEILEKVGFRIINIIIWEKTDPPPLIYKDKFRFSYEFIFWASKKRNKTFNYETMYKINNEEMSDVWSIPAVQLNEKKFGYHPTQKPEKLLRRIILASTNKNDLVLDPFMGSGTTCAVAKKLCRRFIGIEKELTFFKLAKQRIQAIDD